MSNSYPDTTKRVEEIAKRIHETEKMRNELESEIYKMAGVNSLNRVKKWMREYPSHPIAAVDLPPLLARYDDLSSELEGLRQEYISLELSLIHHLSEATLSSSRALEKLTAKLNKATVILLVSTVIIAAVSVLDVLLRL